MSKPSSSRSRRTRAGSSLRSTWCTVWSRLQAAAGSSEPSTTSVEVPRVGSGATSAPRGDGEGDAVAGSRLAVALVHVDAEAGARTATGELAVPDLLVQRVDGVDQRLRSGRAP